MIEAVRLVRSKYVNSAFDGEGARLYGGRWNSKGIPLVYTASSLALAAMEMLVNLGDIDLLKRLYIHIAVSFDKKDVITLNPVELPVGWQKDKNITRTLGDEWVHNGKSLVLEVPSVVIPEEPNYLINPKHPDAGKLSLSAPKSFQFDPRLIKKPEGSSEA